MILCIKGADWLLGSAEKIGMFIGLSPFVVGVLIVGLRTSSFCKSCFTKKTEIALGNIFGSNAFNMLVVVGLPVLAISTLLFIISGISKKIHTWEGAFYLILYIFFLGELFEIL